MITLLASIVGFISSIIPEVLKYFRDDKERKHKLDFIERQIELSKINIASDNQKCNSDENINMLYNYHNLNDSDKNSEKTLTDILNGTVRPVLAYSFFSIYITLKYVQYHALQNHNLLASSLDILWSLEDQAIFASIISFYFGQRTFKKLTK